MHLPPHRVIQKKSAKLSAPSHRWDVRAPKTGGKSLRAHLRKINVDLESVCLKSTFSRIKFNSGASVILCNDLIVSVLTMRMLAPDPSRNYPRSNPSGRQHTNIQHFTLKTICTGTKILMGYRRTAILTEDALVCHFDRPEGEEKSAWRTMQIPRLRATPSARDDIPGSIFADSLNI